MNTFSKAAMESDREMNENRLVYDLFNSARRVAAFRTIEHACTLGRVSTKTGVAYKAAMLSSRSSMILARPASRGTGLVRLNYRDLVNRTRLFITETKAGLDGFALVCGIIAKF